MKRGRTLVLIPFVLATSVSGRRIALATMHEIRPGAAAASQPRPQMTPDEDGTVDDASLASANRLLDAPPRVSKRAGGTTVRLHRLRADASVVSFGVPLPRGAANEAAQVRVLANGTVLAYNVSSLLWYYDAAGQRQGLRAVRIQFPAAAMTGDALDVEVNWTAS